MQKASLHTSPSSSALLNTPGGSEGRSESSGEVFEALEAGNLVANGNGFQASDQDIRISIEAFRGPPKSLTNAERLQSSAGAGHNCLVPRPSLLDPLPEKTRVKVEFSGVNGWVPGTFLAPGLVKSVSRHISRQMAALYWAKEEKKDSRRQILFNITGSVAAGEVLALMGPSGSGKTSLISVLGGRKPKLMDVEGNMLFNGKPLNKAMKRRIGFVLQDDLMYESLTVEETLYYAALLRLPKTMTRSEKKKRVDNVIEALGLVKCRETLIGGFMRRGVSGGERKRVSVGHELLIDPAVLLLDEPTSGLDATTAMHLLTTFRQLAEGGRAILTTIHQPSSRLYRQLDNVLLLSEGHVMYYGAAKLALDWFAHLKYPCPYGVNIADFMLDLANGDMEAEGRHDDDAKDSLIASYAYFSVAHDKGFQLKSELNDRRLSTELKDPNEIPLSVQTPQFVGEADKLQIKSLEMEMSDEPHLDRWGANFGQQITILFQRCIHTRRTDALGTQQYLRLLGVALIAGLLWWQSGGEDTLLSASDTLGLLFFEGLFMSFYAMFRALFTFPSEFRMMLKERTSGMYRLSAYYIARTASDLPMDCSIPTLFVILVYWCGGLRASPVAFFSNWLSVMLVTLVAQSWGMLIGASVMNLQSAQIITSIIMLAFMLVGGFFVRDVPHWVGWLKYGSFIWWGFNLLLKIEFNGRNIVDCGGLDDGPERTVCEPVEDLKDTLNLPSDVNDPVWSNVMVLFAMLLTARLIVYYVLKRKTRA